MRSSLKALPSINPDYDLGDTPTPRCIKLLKHVLFRAFQDLSDKDPHLRRQAAAWFHDTKSRRPMSLYNICSYLDLDHLLVSHTAEDKVRIKSITQTLWRKS